MVRNKALLFLVVLSCFALSSCNLHRGTGAGGGGGNATVSFTLVADTLPANPSILSFKVSIVGIVLTPTSGSAQTLTPATPVVDLMRLQSDTAFLGALPNVPSGSYTVKVSLSNPEIVFLNDTGSTITANGGTCSNNVVCTATLTAAGTPTISSFTFTATSSGQGIELDFNLKNAISLTSGTLSVNFNPASPNPGVFTAFTLPRTNANLGTNQLELIEDFTGVVSISGGKVTITSPTRGTLTATNTSSSFFDQSPDGAHCNQTPVTFTNCVVNGQVASVDAFLKSDGTLDLKEFEPLNQTQQDFVEGIVYGTNSSPTQFTVAVTDKVQLATNSLIGGLNTGDLLTVKISTNPVAQPFLVDSKDLLVPAGSLGLFQGRSDTSAVHPGQTVAVHPTVFTAANGTTPAVVTVDTVILRWSRLTASAVSSATQLLNVNALPSYFNTVSSTQFVVQLFTGTQGTHGVTSFDGVVDGSGIVVNPVSTRALYLESTGNTASPAFFAAKVRQH
jgi:hypothetical protein